MFSLVLSTSIALLVSCNYLYAQEAVTAGLNWYLNEKFRVMANVVKVLDVDRPGSEYDGLSPLIFALRTQWLIY